jgi:acyl-homoserine-lactone acylase
MKSLFRQCTMLVGLILLSACERTVEAPVVPAATTTPEYRTEIRWTRYGIPHVKAEDWAGLGYGFAYATARDGVCVIARELVRVDGEMSRYFGSGESNLSSDIFHKAILQAQRLEAFRRSESEKSADFSRGYVAGYNRYLRDSEDGLPAACNDKPWVRSMTDVDVAKLAIGLAIRYGLGRVRREMAAATPPSLSPAKVASAGLQTDFEAPQGYGSNAIALGSAVTASGRGILFGNPHYPWEGPSRFHMIHTTIPGELDVMGASLLTTPRVAIGFNKDVAWSHTVSTALRATFYELELNPDNPMQYRYGESFRDIEKVMMEVDEVDDEDQRTRGQHAVYFTHYGPVVQSESLPWTTARAYALRDSNLENLRTGPTYDALNKARSVAEVEAAISLQGVSWTNTIAADRDGHAFYADISVAPNVDEELLSRCRLRPEDVSARAVVLNGSDPSCEWKVDERSAIAGVLPAQEMPRLHRQDYVSNSNDSYWLSNPEQPLEGYSPIIGNEGEPRSLRTRAGLSFLQEFLSRGHKFKPEDLQAMIYHQRNYGAELLLDGLLLVCKEELAAIRLEDQLVDISQACSTLGTWDRRMTADSRGGHLWREFWRTGRNIEDVFSVPFDKKDPVHTPRELAVGEPVVRAALLEALAQAVVTLDTAGIPLDAPLGEIQFKEINGQRIPVPGGEGWAGMWSMIIAELETDTGYTPIIHGNSYVQVISWDEEGNLDPRAILTYSQSPEPESAHSSDMTQLYAEGGWVDLPFSDAEIDADPGLEKLLLSE